MASGGQAALGAWVVTGDISQSRLLDFSDRLRVLAMVGVVSVHCNLPWALDPDDLAYNQAGKFVNGLFILVSAYLWQHRGGSSRPAGYLMDRLRSLVTPYAFWAGVTLALVTAWLALSPTRTFALTEAVSYVAFHTALWFIPQLLLALFVSSVLYQRLGVAWSAVPLAAVAVFYAVNVYTGWWDINHTQAPLGFAIFAWAGLAIHDHEPLIRSRLQKVPTPAWGVLVAATFAAGVVEAIALESDDSLRPTNLLYTVVCIGAFLAAGYGKRWRWREFPRGATYGVYLIHTVVMLAFTLSAAALMDDAWQASHNPPWWLNIPARMMLLAVVWFASSGVVRAMNAVGLGRLAGAPPQKHRPSDTSGVGARIGG